MSVSDHIEKLLLRAEIGKPLSREDMLALLKMPGELAPELFAAAERIRKNEVGDEIDLPGVIEISNDCQQNCLYCGRRSDNVTLTRYRMTDEDILQAARGIKACGLATVVLQSGDDVRYPVAHMCKLVQNIRQETDLAVTLALGERSLEDYRAFFEAGAGRYLLKFETASPELYQYLHPGCQLAGRVSPLKTLKHLGFEIGTGNRVGFPGQTHEILADDLLLMKLLDADMVIVEPFMAHPDTPLAGIETDDLDLTLRVIAIARLLTRNTDILATPALTALHPHGRIQALQAGANGVMQDFTPDGYKRLSGILPGKTDVGSPKDTLDDLKKDFQLLGRVIGHFTGRRPDKTNKSVVH